MKWLTAGLTFVNAATICGLLTGAIAQGLGATGAWFSLLLGLGLAGLAWVKTARETGELEAAPRVSFSRVCFWFVAGCFGVFAFRSFCWLLFIDSNQLKVQSANNLGDLSLHLAYIRNFASGVPLWPDNVIFAFGKMRYPAGTDLFNGLLLLAGMDLTRGLIWAGLLGSLATFYSLYRWGGSFTVAGFLFNGGIAGFQVLQRGKFLDYQGDKAISWKSLPLAMFVTQRGLLYAIPAGLLLLYQWRALFVLNGVTRPEGQRGRVPFWIELSLYATLPLFHLHTFMALSIVAAFLFVLGDNVTRKHLGRLVVAAVVPATFLVWVITDHFSAGSLLTWKPGWTQLTGDFAAPFWTFWFLNFGLLPLFVIALFGFCCWRLWKSSSLSKTAAQGALPFLIPAAFLFLFACLVKTAPWEWDNIKIILWAYLIMLPFLWTELISRWPISLRIGLCLMLFTSGFVSLFGGLLSSPGGYSIAERAEVDLVGSAVRKLPPAARFAAYPDYNHPLLLQGRKVVLGYPGHLWSQGFNYAELEKRLQKLMLGAPDWREQASYLGARYLFWGREEKANYSASSRPWETQATLVTRGSWGEIYDLKGKGRP